MKCEIESAANFLSNMLKLHSNVLTTEQLERFKDAIETHLQDQYQHHWFPDRPTKGSGYRCIRINHKLDPILSKAGQSCGIDSQRLSTIFPNELTLWVDPHEVSYRIGENGSICVLFDGRSGDANSNGTSDHKNSPSNKQQNHHLNDVGKGHRSVISVNRHHQNQQQQIRSAGTGRFSPTDSTLSSSTSTMSSPSPSSSPDWCRMSYDRHSSPENWVKNQGTMLQMNGGAFTDHHHHHHQHTPMHHQVQPQQHAMTNGHHTANIRRSSPISVMGFGSPSANGINGGGGPSSLEGVSLYNGFHHSTAPTMPFTFNYGVVNGNTVGVGVANGGSGSGTNVTAVLRNGANGHSIPMASQQQGTSVTATGPNQSGHFNAAFTNGRRSPYVGC